MILLEPVNIRRPAHPPALPAWPVERHAGAGEAPTGMRPKASGEPSVSREQGVDEVPFLGWIDGGPAA